MMPPYFQSRLRHYAAAFFITAMPIAEDDRFSLSSTFRHWAMFSHYAARFSDFADGHYAFAADYCWCRFRFALMPFQLFSRLMLRHFRRHACLFAFISPLPPRCWCRQRRAYARIDDADAAAPLPRATRRWCCAPMRRRAMSLMPPSLQTTVTEHRHVRRNRADTRYAPHDRATIWSFTPRHASIRHADVHTTPPRCRIAGVRDDVAD